MSKTSHNMSVWEGDGLPEDDEEALDYIRALGFLKPDLEGIYEACKREGWVREQLAKHERGEGKEEDAEASLAMSRWWWRRAQRWKELTELYWNRDEE